MPKVPPSLRPGRIIRRKAMRQGIRGSSSFWKFVAVVVFGRSTIKKIFGKNEELVTREVFRSGGYMTVEPVKLMTRRDRKKAKKLAS